MNSLKVTIVGMGLMGGSLAWAIKDQVHSLSAVDPDPETRDLVRSAGIVERVVDHPAEVLPQADVVILAAPVRSILEIIPKIPDWHPGKAMVLDLGSTKKEICHLLENLPARFEALGGHPICGQVEGGFQNASPDLYRDAAIAYSALSNTSERCKIFAEELAGVIGADPVWIDPIQHDFYLSATSHLPYILAAALCLNSPQGSSPFRGSGFESSSRLAGTNRTMMFDVLKTNRRNILVQIDQLQIILDEFKDQLQTGKDQELLAMMDLAAAIKNKTAREAS